MEKIWDIKSKNQGIYWGKTIGNFKGCIRRKLWDILSKTYGVYYEIYLLKIVGYIWLNYGIYWSKEYINQKLSDKVGKLWDI